MPGHQIKCLYCFKEFDDAAVHFRMETVFNSEDDIEFTDPNTGKEYYSVADITKDPMLSNAARTQLIDRFKTLAGFVQQEDPEYEKFWKKFGGTTEMPAKAHDGVAGVDPWLRRVYDPNNPADQQFFSSTEGPVISDSGLLYKVTDCLGRETTRRVCPFCHNPLPGLYGKYPVKFISIIGITGAGKTVYLSQLVQWFVTDLAKCGITVNPTSMYAYKYRDVNPVEMQRRLPEGTPPQQMQQPLCFDLTYNDEVGRAHNMTMVFYDIAGENCQLSYDDSEVATKAKEFGPFIEHSDGILLVVQPQQFSEPDPVGGPQAVLNVVHGLFDAHANDLDHIPMAVCISKGDIVVQQVLGSQSIPNLQYLKVGRKYRPVFNADSYNKLYEPVYNFVERQSAELIASLSVDYPIHDLFMVSAIGTAIGTFKDDEGEYEAPAAPPLPQRLVEPLLWMLNRFGFIGSTGFINEPNDWFCPQCNRRLHITQEFCPDCKCTEDGRWMCPLCGTVNPAGTAQCSHTEKGFLGMTKRCKGTPIRH
ncbi:TRAFAC clade GTPase domain-containing protein [Bifidobacterium callimiconis]|uniref:Double-GTPase 2 domain-containing protein n=1 Tax=Bifidobacterium callimiconis TaxID=2306973 RepID=A0A430FC40_9BIFI|nr:hypothetical protein [Bifidobacterium callimiconis]MBT1177693.1 hypothetical protein [Bifidobacterium callimiconis]RSX50368.1 hypothetical protein D2E23_1691 [Bifidobacterium callimiconis]